MEPCFPNQKGLVNTLKLAQVPLRHFYGLMGFSAALPHSARFGRCVSSPLEHVFSRGSSLLHLVLHPALRRWPTADSRHSREHLHEKVLE